MFEDGIKGVAEGVAGPRRNIADRAVDILIVGRHGPVVDDLEETKIISLLMDASIVFKFHIWL